ncbi:hypothetical protein SAMN05421757_101831 [Tropicimonas sediminicola]|uniref:Uncharacterized protein n=1 Tax=Tropicimonas sediminicola TaxID=1031541 RepID=A0A239DJB4_9RHOB|nr:hypothetical protein SAMN05421757_101831 [Tropicimonas sediminicola]
MWSRHICLEFPPPRRSMAFSRREREHRLSDASLPPSPLPQM